MPDVIDNVKVGEYIKTLLSKHQMTQNDLAVKLNMSRSAVSQNLSGRSTFDLQNLMKIAEIFSISVDQLLQMKTKKSDDVVSEYQRLLRKGLTELKTINKEKINLSTPDIYGKTFVEYVIEQDNEKVFLYLVEEQYNLYISTHTHAQEVLENIITYAASKQSNHMFEYIHQFVKIFGYLYFIDEDKEKRFFISIEGWKDETIKKRLLTELVKVHNTSLHIFKIKHRRAIISTVEWAKYIAKYHMNETLKVFLKTHSIAETLDVVIEYFVQYGYINGCELLIKNLTDNDISVIRKNHQIIQRAINLISKIDRIDLLKLYLKNEIVSNYTELAINTTSQEQKDMTKYILKQYGHTIDFKKLGHMLVETNNLIMLKELIEFFMQDDKDFVLSKTNRAQKEMTQYLVEHNATFQLKYFNRETAHKMNVLLTHYKEKVEK